MAVNVLIVLLSLSAKTAKHYTVKAETIKTPTQKISCSNFCRDSCYTYSLMATVSQFHW